MGKTAIQWTDETHNVQRGCDPVSPGCAHCWAAAMASRFSAAGEAFEGLAKRKSLPGGGSLAVWTDKDVMLLPDKLLDILSWKRPKRVFLNSVSDTFHADVPFEFIAALWAFMACAPEVTFQVVTKRARRMREFFEWTRAHGGPDTWLLRALELCDRQIGEHVAVRPEMWHRWKKARETIQLRFKAVTARAELTRGTTLEALENVWLLVSTENQDTYDERVAELLQCPAVVRGISAEPLLGPIDLGLGCWIRLPRTVVRQDENTGVFAGHDPQATVIPAGVYRAHLDGLGLRVDHRGSAVHLRLEDYESLPDIDWAIIGGESGAGCRWNDLTWTRSILWQIGRHNERAVRAGGPRVYPFVKQLGGAAVDAEHGLVGALYPKPPKTERGWILRRLKDKHGGNEDEFPADLRGYRHFPVPRPPAHAPTVTPAGQLGLAL